MHNTRHGPRPPLDLIPSPSFLIPLRLFLEALGAGFSLTSEDLPLGREVPESYISGHSLFWSYLILTCVMIHEKKHLTTT